MTLTSANIDETMQHAWEAFLEYRKLSFTQRANFLRTIAQNLEDCSDEIYTIANAETNLPEARLRNEKARTIFQLRSYADACERGNWLQVKIDTANTERVPPKPDLRKTQQPLGPVVVFGASNFPFAYSTAGGDTASAFAAGCTVVVKAHPAHLKTSKYVANLIFDAVKKCNLSNGTFSHVEESDYAISKELIQHPHTKAVGFTGSFTGGKQMFDWANERKEPIPVFAEMGSTNPVFLLQEKLNTDAEAVAKMFAASITLGVGQFCTKPGIIVGIEGEGLTNFTNALVTELKNSTPALMLHQGIATNYKKNAVAVLQQNGVKKLLANSNIENDLYANPTIAATSAKEFLQNTILHQEVFGPYVIIVSCATFDEMQDVAKILEGQLTATVMATSADLKANEILIDTIKTCCGRIILNAVPTGVEVVEAMQHGGPYPASTDGRFGSVGADAIARFTRPIAYQNWDAYLLPDELKNENPLQIWRTVNNELTKDPIA
ncbi:MAG: aldehyde dehydrogenase (NADP(+)) [Ferruginibacter sp.]|nr:aldehyde dehydrogenase (NADP(+)) [Ferruginibacter sp.]